MRHSAIGVKTCSGFLTDSVAFPAAAALAEARAVHHVALIVPLVKPLAHFVRQSVYNTLI